MKKIQLLPIFTLIAVLSTAFISCSDDDDDDLTPNPAVNQPTNPSNPMEPAPTLNLAQLADSTSDLDSLAVALKLSGLDAALSGTEKYTVIAPNNAAFRTLISDLNILLQANYSQLSDIPIGQLTQVLEYHVLQGEIKSSDLNDDSYGVSLNNSGAAGENVVVEVDVTGGVTFNNSASVITANIAATNGRLHTVDGAILPFNVIGPIAFDERFDSLEVALSRPGFTFIETIRVATTLSTIFAPTNKAFNDLLDSNPNYSRIADIPDFELELILENHIVLNSNVRSDELMQGQTIQPMNSTTLTVDLTNGAQLTNSNTTTPINIIGTDYQGSNGVVHAIDQVIP